MGAAQLGSVTTLKYKARDAPLRSIEYFNKRNSLYHVSAQPDCELVKYMGGINFSSMLTSLQLGPVYRLCVHFHPRPLPLLIQRRENEREPNASRVARVLVALAASELAARAHDGCGRLGVAVARVRLRCALPQALENRCVRERRPRLRMQLVTEVAGNASKRGNARIAPASSVGYT